MRHRLLSCALATLLALACASMAIPLFPSIPGNPLGRPLPAPIRVTLAPASPPAAHKPGWTSYTNDANHVSDIAFDRDGTPWTGGPGGVVRWDLAQGTYTRYTVDDGLAYEYVYSIAVAPDGALWCGTDGGGVSRFSPDRSTWTTYTTADGLAGNVVWSIAMGSGGTLWFGTDGGLSSFDGRTWTTHTQSATTGVVVGPDGAVWSCSGARSFPMGTEPGGVLRLSPDGERQVRYTEGDGLACDVAFCIAVAPDGAMWFGTMDGVSRLAPDENAWTTYTEEDGLASNGAISIAFDSDGAPWVSTLRVSCLIDLDGLCHFDGEMWTTYAIDNSVLHDGVSDIAAGPDGALWFGADGLSRYDGETLITYAIGDSPADNWIHAIAVDPSGALWCGTAGHGVSRFDGQTWTTYTTAEGLAGDEVLSIAVQGTGSAPDGALWFGTWGGVSRFDGQTWTTYVKDNGPARPGIVSIAPVPVSRDAVWVIAGNAAFRFDGRTWVPYATADEPDTIQAIAVAPDGAVWLGVGGYEKGSGVVRFPQDAAQDRKRWSTYTVADGLAYDDVESIAVGPISSGTLWFGTDGGGVSLFRDGKTGQLSTSESWTTYTIEDGLVDDRVHAIAVAPDGVAWFGTPAGVSRFDGQTWTTYTEKDGLVDNWVHSIAIASDGTVWFGTWNGISCYVPQVPLPE